MKHIVLITLTIKNVFDKVMFYFCYENYYENVKTIRNRLWVLPVCVSCFLNVVLMLFCPCDQVLYK